MDKENGRPAQGDQSSGFSAKLTAITTYLRNVYGDTPTGNVVITTYHPDVTVRHFSSTAEAARYAVELDECGAYAGVYCTGATVRPDATGRGKASDATALYYLALDMDVWHPAAHRGSHLPRSLADCRDLVADLKFPPPTRWIDSGYGYYPQWQYPAPLMVADHAAVQAAYNEVKAYVQAAYERYGWKADATFDLARVWRVPGTTNRKAPTDPRPARVIEESGTFTALDELLAVARSARPSTNEVPPAGDEPFPFMMTGVPAGGPVGAFTDRPYTMPAAEAYVEQHALAPLRTARNGDQNNQINRSALVVAHFRNFWTEQHLYQLLLDNLPEDYRPYEHSARTTIASAFAAFQRYRDNGDLDNGWLATLRQPDAEVAIAPSNIPAAFWESRPELKHIRDAAHARGRSADAVLGGLLARLAALTDHKLRCDTGVGNPACLNFIAAIVSRSGGGKSSSSGIPRALLPDDDLEERPLGSGEGIAEAFMGMVQATKVETDDQGNPREVPDGKKQVKKQVRHNLLLSKDEGMELVKVLERTGATVAEAMRSAWSGETIGQSNGTVETTRIIREGTYSLGIVVGFQEEAAAPLLAQQQVAIGTPQRFVWFNAADPGIPHPARAPGEPGPLDLAPWERAAGALHIGQGETMTVDPDLREEIRVKDWLRNRDDGTPESKAAIEELSGVNSHKPLTLIKLACLLALLSGRYNVTREDWDLATMIWETSCLIRRRIQRAAELAAERQQVEAMKRAHARSKASEQGKQEANGDALEAVTAFLLDTLRKQPRWTAGKLKNAVTASRRHLFEDAIATLVENGQVSVNTDSRSKVINYLQ